jgi:hypothetical protein
VEARTVQIPKLTVRVRFPAITDEGVAVGGAFDTATGMTPAAQRVAGVLTFRRS